MLLLSGGLCVFVLFCLILASVGECRLQQVASQSTWAQMEDCTPDGWSTDQPPALAPPPGLHVIFPHLFGIPLHLVRRPACPGFPSKLSRVDSSHGWSSPRVGEEVGAGPGISWRHVAIIDWELAVGGKHTSPGTFVSRFTGLGKSLLVICVAWVSRKSKWNCTAQIVSVGGLQQHNFFKGFMKPPSPPRAFPIPPPTGHSSWTGLDCFGSNSSICANAGPGLLLFSGVPSFLLPQHWTGFEERGVSTFSTSATLQSS